MTKPAKPKTTKVKGCHVCEAAPTHRRSTVSNEWVIECSRPFVTHSVYVRGRTRADAIRAWNRRKP